MTNNDILRRLRYAFSLNDKKMMQIFASADHPATREEISDWLKKDDDESYKGLSDKNLAVFLNGLINEKRGKREDVPQPVPEKVMTNNMVLNKLKIALNLKSEDVLTMLKLANFTLSKHELSALFRKPGHKHYRECKDQILRNFLKSIQIKFRPTEEDIEEAEQAERAAVRPTKHKYSRS